MPEHRILRADWDETVKRLTRLGEQVIHYSDDGDDHVVLKTVVVGGLETRQP